MKRVENRLIKSRIVPLAYRPVAILVSILLPAFAATPAFAQSPQSGREIMETDLKSFQRTSKDAIREMKSVLQEYKTGSNKSALSISEVLAITRQELQRFRLQNRRVMKEARKSGVPRLKSNVRLQTLLERSRSRLPAPRTIETEPGPRIKPAPASIRPEVTFASLERDRRLLLQLQKKQAETARPPPIDTLSIPENETTPESETTETPESEKKIPIYLSIEDRRARYDIEQREQELAAKARQTEAFRLRAEIMQGSLKTQQEKLAGLSKKIRNLLKNLESGRSNPRTALLELGSAYLESQRTLNAMNPEDSLKLVRLAKFSRTVLGSYELAIWAVKRALRFDPSDGEAHSTLSAIYDEIGDGLNAIRQAKTAKHLYRKSGPSTKVDETQQRIVSLETKYAPD